MRKFTRKSPSAITFCDFQWLGKCFILSYTIKNFFLLILMFSITGLMSFSLQAQEPEGLPYLHDFSTDPGWVTNNPTNFKWDSASGAYYSKSITGSGEFSGVQTDYNGGSFVAAFDIKVTTRSADGEAIFGLFGPAYTSYQVSPYDKPCIYISIGGSQNRFKIVAITNTGAQYGVYPGNTVELNKWYRIAMCYDNVNNKIGMTVRERDGNPNVFFINTTTNINGSFPSDMKYLGLSMVGEWASSGKTQEVFLDNVKCVLAGAISGKVTRDDGSTPIADVYVNLYPYAKGVSLESNLASGQTQSNGTYSLFCVDPGAYRLSAFPPYGYGPQYYENTTAYGQAKPVYVQPGRETPNIDFALAAGGKISGHVYEADGTTPIPGERVGLHKSDDTNYNWGAGTDSAGFYTINVPYGGYKVKVGQNNAYKPEYYNAKPTIDTADVVSVSAAGDANGIDFTLDAGTTLTGIVLDEDFNRVPGNETHYNSYEMRLGGSITASTSDVLGKLFFFGLPEGWMRFHANSKLETGLAESGVNPATGFFIDGTENIKNFPLICPKGALATGYLKDANGNPMLRGWINVGGKNVDSGDSADINGRYQLRIPTGTHWLSISNDNNPDLCAIPQEITVTDTASAINLPDIVVYDTSTGSTISGQIIDSAGTKQGKFSVYAVQAGEGRDVDNLYSLNPIQQLLKIDSAGPYTFTSLPPNNNYLVALGVGNSLSSPWYLSIRDFVDNISVPATGVNLNYASIGGTVSGKVLDVANNPIPYATVLLSRQQDGLFMGYAYTNQNGEYILYNFQPGSHNVIATHPRYPNSATVSCSVSDNQATNVPDIILASPDEQAIRNVYNSLKANEQAEDISGVMANYADNYVNSNDYENVTSASLRSELIDEFSEFKDISANFNLKSIDIVGDRALVKYNSLLEAVKNSDGKKLSDFYPDQLDYFKKEGGTWKIYGNQELFSPLVSVIYSPGPNYGLHFRIHSLAVNISSVTVSGALAGTVTLYDDGAHWDGEAGDGRWGNFISLGSQSPSVGDEYEFAITGTNSMAYRLEYAISNIFKQTTALISPIGGASVSGKPLFQWQALPGAYRYFVSVYKGTSPNLSSVWSVIVYGRNNAQIKFDENDAEEPLQNGQAYSWKITPMDQDSNQTSTNYSTFTYSNQAPILGAIGNKTVNESQKLEFNISASDPDGDPLEYAVSGLPAGATFDASTRTFSWTPTYSQAGTYNNITFTVTDGNQSDSEEITISVNNVNLPPQVGTINPSSGSSKPGQQVAFTATYFDPDGWEDIYSASFLVNVSTSKKNCLYAYYNQNTNKLYLRNDADTSWLGGFAAGSNNIIENSYVKLDCAKTTVLGGADKLSVKWVVTFKSLFSPGSKNTYLYVRDNANAYSGWVKKGTWVITNLAPSAGAITPASGSSKPGQQVNFTTTYTDPNGYADLKEAKFLVNTSTSSKNCGSFYYDQNNNKLYLRNNSDTAWLGGFAPGSAKIIENSYVKLYCAQTTAGGSSNKLTVKWTVTFKSTFTGAKNTYLYAQDDSNIASGWIHKGTWKINS